MELHTRRCVLLLAACLTAVCSAPRVHAQVVALDEGDLRALRDAMQPGGEDPSGDIRVFHTSLLLVGMSEKGALTTAQGSQSDTSPMWKMPHSFAVEGRYVYVVKTRAHAFIPHWKEVIRRLEEDLARSATP